MLKTVQDIRLSFKEHFLSKNHFVEQSASLLPYGDPSLLFTTAGMVPFKDYFSGETKPIHDKIVSIQKCIRTTDLDEVGKTQRHLSFFEMLGNFAFGSYFKKEAIKFAWEYSIEHLGFEPAHIWASVYEKDKEAYEIWKNYIRLPTERIVYLGKKDNFWGPAGEYGVCGPCSELYFDRGIEKSSTKDDVKPGSDGERFWEFWNLVFNEFVYNRKKQFEPLVKKGIDTGAGLERIAALIQGVDNVYETNELKAIKASVCKLYQIQENKNNITAIQTITDHIRSLTFSIADHIYPANESRGYVIRRILRRALLQSFALGKKTPQLFQLVDTIDALYGKEYPEIHKEKQTIQDIIQKEEQLFLKTLDFATTKFNSIIDELKFHKKSVMSGEQAFLLYDTYGLPLESTMELAQKHNISVDTLQFQAKMQEQKEKSHNVALFGQHNKSKQFSVSDTITAKLPSTKFVGYDTLEVQAEVVHLFSLASDTQEMQSIQHQENPPSQDKENANHILAIFSHTPFYPEGGGQVADIGTISSPKASGRVYDVQKKQDAIFHYIQLENGQVSVGDTILLKVDISNRNILAAHHSATHLLHSNLIQVLGDGVKQNGSFIDNAGLRFDFTHNMKVSEQQIEQIEKSINNTIDSAESVTTQVLPIEEAHKTSAIQNFEEKYSEVVRIVDVGTSSKEFCGGTHVRNTRDIGFFVIKKESSVGSGVRRIEASCSGAAFAYLKESQKQYQGELEKIQLTKENALQTDFCKLQETLNALNKNKFSYNDILAFRKIKTDISLFVKKYKKEKNKSKESVKNIKDHQTIIENALQNIQKQNNIQYTFIENNLLNIKEMRSIADICRQKNTECFYFFVSFDETTNRWYFLAAVSRKYALDSSIHLGKMFQNAFSKENKLQGKGGGKEELFQGSGIIYQNMSHTLQVLKELTSKVVFKT